MDAAPGSVKSGSSVAVPLTVLTAEHEARFLSLIAVYALFNPHGQFTLRLGSKVQCVERTTQACRKWRPNDATSAHWYTPEQLRALMAACVTAERSGGSPRTVRDFIGEFRGLSSTVKRKRILARLPHLAGLSLGDCVQDGDIDPGVVSALLQAMRAETNPVKPADLGILGKTHVEGWLARQGGVTPTIRYQRVSGVDESTGLPFVFEFAFGARNDDECRRLYIGINSAPTLVDPFRSLTRYGVSLEGLLNQHYVVSDAPVTCIAHLTCPHLRFTDRGKSALEGL